MEREVSRFSFLLEALGIPGKELAAALHVDNSLVSKWRRTRRSLSPRSEHLQRICEYIVSHYSPLPLFLREQLREYDPDLDLEDTQRVTVCLGRWLTEPDPSLGVGPFVGVHPRYQVFRGNEGRQEAVLVFLDQVLAMPANQDLLLVSQEEMTWLTGDPEFTKTWKERLGRVLQAGHTIKIIHWVDRDLESLRTIIRQWLPLYLTGSICSWFYPRYTDPGFKTTMFMVPSKLAVMGMEGSSPSQRYTAIFTDPITTGHAQWIFSTLMAQCRPLIHLTPCGEMKEKIIQMKGEAQLLSGLPTYHTLGADLIGELTQGTIAPSSLTGRQILSLPCLRTACQTGQISDPLLTALLGRQVYITEAQFRQHIQALIRRLDSDGLEVALVEEVPQANLWLSSEGVLAWSALAPYAASVTEPTVVQAFYRVFEDFWESIPRVNRDPHWVQQELTSLIDV